MHYMMDHKHIVPSLPYIHTRTHTHIFLSYIVFLHMPVDQAHSVQYLHNSYQPLGYLLAFTNSLIIN